MRSCLALLCLATLTGCASTNPRLLLPAVAGAASRSAEELIESHPVPKGQNILPLLLGQTESLSYHLVQIRDRESPHIHASHDLVVTLLRGEGALHQGESVLPMHAGDTAVVPKGVPHFFVNTGDQPAAAFVTFAPPYDGKDNVPAE